MLILTIIKGPDRGRRFEMPDNEPQLIGRSSEALPLSDTAVSRRHAELTPDNGAWWIRDLHSQNGTYVNGLRITSRTRLKHGDQIQVGATHMLFGPPEGEKQYDYIRVLLPGQIETSVERTLPSNEDSVILAEPEPRAAAMDHLRIIYQLTTLTAKALDRQDYLRQVMDLVFDEFKPERGFVMLGGASSYEPLQPAVVKHRTPPLDLEDRRIGVSRTILQHVVRRGEGVLSTNAMNDPRFAKGDSVQRMAIRSAICAPIKFRERVFGAMYIDSSLANYTFTEEQLALMNAIGQHVGLALANAELITDKLQAQRLAAIGETVASLSHSIKNILQGLRGGADVVEMGLKKGDLKLGSNGWDILKRNLDRIAALTMNMLTFSRRRAVEMELTPIGPLLQDCAMLLEGHCRAKEVALIIDVDPEMPPIPMDPHMLHQALMNLMTNAVEAVAHGQGHVTVRATYHAPGQRGEGSPATAEIAVIDNGPGIPPPMRASRDRLFEPFQTTKGSRGTGLGLAVTKRIIDEHHGHIRLDDSDEPGTTFRIFLPADPSQTIDPSATATALPGLPGPELDATL